MTENQTAWPVGADRDFRVRALVNGEFVELYVDDRLVQCFGFTRPVAAGVGLFAEWLSVSMKDLRAWEFDL
jgi:hypothetical protein